MNSIGRLPMRHESLQGMLDLAACPQCDLLIREASEASNRRCSFDCPRCGARLHRNDRVSLESILALACAALVLLVVANAFPVLGLDANGQRTDITILGAIQALWQAQMQPVAALVLLTTVATPLLEVSTILWLALPLWLGRRPLAFVSVMRLLKLARPWAMTEVFMLGMLVAMVKLAHFADLLPGIGIWSFGGLMLLLTALTVLTEPRDLWRTWEAARR
jgi:paraquat-inducible protein A